MTAGLIALLAALVVGTAGGLAWQRSNGRMRGPAEVVTAPAEASRTAPLTSSTVANVTINRDTGNGTGPRLGPAELGEALGERATLVQFSSAFCAPCRATRRILADVAGMVDGVSHVEIDAESRLDLVRAHGVLRTPTVFVLAGDGRIVRRASGQPRKADVIAAVGAAVAAPGRAYENTAAPAPAEDIRMAGTGDAEQADISYPNGLETS